MKRKTTLCRRRREATLLSVLPFLLAAQHAALPTSAAAWAATTKQTVKTTSPVPWSRLELHASKFFISVNSEIELSTLARSSAEEDLLVPGKGRPIGGSGAQTLLMRISSKLLGRETNTRLWFDPAGYRALQRIQHETGKRNRYKVNRFTESGVFTLRRNPDQGEEQLPQERWTKVSETFTPYPVPDTRGLVVTEPSALFYIVSAADLARPGQKMQLHVFSRDHLNRVEMTVEGSEQIRVDYVQMASGREQRIKTAAEAVHISLVPRPIEGDPDALDFRLLGLEGDIDLFLDPEHRFPLQVSGRIRPAGKVRVRLRRVVLE